MPYNCVFCRIVNGSIPSLRVYEDDFTLAVMDVARDVDGHMLVIPKAHCQSLLDCDEQLLAYVMAAVKKVSDHLVNNCGYQGVNLLNASGESAGQSVSHFHIHIIPRKTEDGINAWPVFPGAKHAIESVYERVKMI